MKQNTRAALVAALGLDPKAARELLVRELVEPDGAGGYRYIGPAEKVAARPALAIVRWRLRRMKAGSALDPESAFFVRAPRQTVESNYLTIPDTKRLFRTLREQSGRAFAGRDVVLIRLAYQTGLRVAELAALNVGSVVEDERLEVRRDLLVLGKGKKFRKIGLRQDLRVELARWLKAKKKQKESIELSAPLFISRKDNRLSVRQIETLVTAWAARAGVNRITAHGLRHTCLTHMVQGSPMGLLAAKRHAGHSNIATTEKYLHLSADDYGEALEGLV